MILAVANENSQKAAFPSPSLTPYLHKSSVKMKMAHCWLLLLLALALSLLSTAAADLPLVCIVIRTYYGHGTYGDSSLINLLHSLKQQSHSRFVALHHRTALLVSQPAVVLTACCCLACRWHALLLVMDNRPFPDLRHIVRDADDERIQVFAEWVSIRQLPNQSCPHSVNLTGCLGCC
jgi:hypothetical protein